MMYTLLVIDFDVTYDLEPEDEFGVEPAVYLIPLNKQKEVEKTAEKARDIFYETNSGSTILDIFERLLNKKGVKYQYIGDLKITFGERQTDYLPDYLPKVVV